MDDQDGAPARRLLKDAKVRYRNIHNLEASIRDA